VSAEIGIKVAIRMADEFSVFLSSNSRHLTHSRKEEKGLACGGYQGPITLSWVVVTSILVASSLLMAILIESVVTVVTSSRIHWKACPCTDAAK